MVDARALITAELSSLLPRNMSPKSQSQRLTWEGPFGAVRLLADLLFILYS